jgi:hypothetical protein
MLEHNGRMYQTSTYMVEKYNLFGHDLSKISKKRNVMFEKNNNTNRVAIYKIEEANMGAGSFYIRCFKF